MRVTPKIYRFFFSFRQRMLIFVFIGVLLNMCVSGILLTSSSYNIVGLIGGIVIFVATLLFLIFGGVFIKAKCPKCGVDLKEGFKLTSNRRRYEKFSCSECGWAEEFR